jgi:hypothetical protein
MFQYADRTACPRCRATLTPPSTSCASCEADLTSPAAYDVFLALQKVDQLVHRLYDVAPVARPVPDAPITPAPEPVLQPAAAAARSVNAAFAAADATTTGEIPPVPPLPSYRPSVPRSPAPRTIMSGLTVPKILLGLGALCLVVAALVFLVVAWQELGVAGRTLVLVAFTLIATGLAGWSARSGLRAGAESLTVVALGLLLLDLAGARTSGWFGDLGEAGFAVLAGTVLAAVSIAGAVAARHTQEPKLISAEIAAVLGLLSVDTGLGGVVGNDWTATATWATAALAASGVAAAATARARLQISTIGIAGLAAVSWLALALTGLGRLIDNPSWAGLADGFRIWPLLLAAAVAGSAAAVRPVPVPARVGAAASAVLLVSAIPVGPVTDGSGQAVALVLVGLVAAHAAAAWRLPLPWTWVTAAPTTLAGGYLGVVSLGLAAFAATRVLDHGLWTGTVGTIADHGDLAKTWAFLLPLTTAATVLACSTLLRCIGAQPARLLGAGTAATIATAAIAPVLHAAPLAAVAACLVLGTAAMVAIALRSTNSLDRIACWALACVTGILALGTALVDDGTTVAVLAVLVAALVAAELRGTDALREVGHWALPLAAAALAWSIASMAGMPLEWRATPAIAVLAALALLRPSDGHEASGLAAGLVATLVSAAHLFEADPSGDQRLLAAHLAAIAAVAGTIALVRSRDLAGLAALAIFPLAAIAAWEDRATAVVVLALLTGFALALEVRRVGGALPVWQVARVAVPLAGGSLLWSLTQLAVEHGLDVDRPWTALPVVLVMGAVVLRWPSYDRDSAAGIAATVAVAAATIEPTTIATDALACYLALGAITCTASALMQRDRTPLAWGGLGLFAAAALVAAEHPWLQLALLAILTATCVLHELRDDEDLSRGGRMGAPLAGGALLWVGAGLADVPDLARAVPVVVVLGALAVWRAEPEREVPAAATAALAAVVSLTGPLGPDQTWVAAYLTLAGVATTASSLLHESRRRLAWAGLAFFSLAQWLRLEELGVDTVEAYTLPLAVVLLVVGTRALLTGDRSSLRTQGAGLGLAVVPTLLQVLVEPLGPRAVLLGIGSLLLIGVGVRQRWAAPLLAGGGAIAVLVLRQATHASVLPQWALIGLAGVVLTFVGLTWERRLADVRRAADYVRGLR